MWAKKHIFLSLFSLFLGHFRAGIFWGKQIIRAHFNLKPTTLNLPSALGWASSAWVRIAQTCPLTAAQRRLVNPRAALRSVGTVVVVVACKAHAHRPPLFSLACGLRGALYYRKGTGCLYYCIINNMRMQHCNVLYQYQSPGTDFARTQFSGF